MKTKSYTKNKIIIGFVIISIIFSLIFILPLSFAANITSIMLNVGEDESVRTLVFQSDTEKTNEVQYTFANNEKDFSAASTATTIQKKLITGKWKNIAKFENLSPNTEYMYKIKGDTNIYTFQTGSAGNNFSFAALGDPQIGVGDLQKEKESWEKTLNTVSSNFPNIELMVSLGDQVNAVLPLEEEKEYDAFSEPAMLKKYPIAAVPGNHELATNKPAERFYFPNETQYGKEISGADYFFKHKNTLFIMLNSNEKNATEHDKAIQAAISKYPDAKYKIVCFHHSIYSVASHREDIDILNLRKNLVPVFDKNKIDLVLMGHDHVYVRTPQMKNNEIVNKDEYYFGDGVVYTTLNSSSGSKHYGIKGDYPYVHSAFQLEKPEYTIVNVSDDEISVNTYAVEDKSLVDGYTIKTKVNTPTDNPNQNEDNTTEDNTTVEEDTSNQESENNDNNADANTDANNDTNTENTDNKVTETEQKNENTDSTVKDNKNLPTEKIENDKIAKTSPKTSIVSMSTAMLSIALTALTAMTAAKKREK
ncbi:MAG: metallophosphoesterase family protein [Clostridia bacterium]|nr:metallophosphoesterase family protein [Clostridia bacterium]